MSSFISCSPFDFSLAEGAAFEADAHAERTVSVTFRIISPNICFIASRLPDGYLGMYNAPQHSRV